jgi:signal transduction histidine kinase
VGTPIEKNLRLIEKETKRCKEIIDNLLSFARQERASLQPTHINPVVQDAIAIVNHQLGMHRIEMECELADDLPVIHGNSNQLQQVVMNLIMNAQQAMEGEPGTIRVSTSLSSERLVQIDVADTGPGMSDEIKSKLFEPFFTTKPGGKGTGLGLSVSYGIIKDHNGEIAVATTAGEGSTFTISLPLLEDLSQPPYMSTESA